MFLLIIHAIQRCVMCDALFIDERCGALSLVKAAEMPPLHSDTELGERQCVAVQVCSWFDSFPSHKVLAGLTSGFRQ